MRRVWYTLLLAAAVFGQSCENFGISNNSVCACPTGFGGGTCSQPGCAGTIFQGSQRPLTPVPSGSFANLTAGGCLCEDGWTGTGCNVCQTSNACQKALAATGVQISDPQAGLQGVNHTLTCSTIPRVWAAGQMSCRVDDPTLKALYPLASTLNIMRTLQPTLTPIPNATAFGDAGSVFAQLFYDGVEQFYCQANTCNQELGSSGNDSSNWECQNLQCSCRRGTSFCGGTPTFDLTSTINALGGSLGIECGSIDNTTNSATCNFKQSTLQTLFGPGGLTLNGCTFGECISQNIIDNGGNLTSSASNGGGLNHSVIAGLSVVGGLLLLALLLLLFGLYKQRVARKSGYTENWARVAIEWTDLSYVIPNTNKKYMWLRPWTKRNGYSNGHNDDKTVLDSITGNIQPGQMMAVLGPSGAGKTTLIEILAGKGKSGVRTGSVKYTVADNGTIRSPRIGFVSQQDILPPTLTVYEVLLFAARLRLPEGISDIEKIERVVDIMEKLGITSVKNSRIGFSNENGAGKARGISGGEMRRVSIGLELIASPDVLILDEPTSGLDSVSAARVSSVLHAIAHDPEHPIPVIASIHQPSSQLYQKFDHILLLSHGRAAYSGPGSFAPVEYLTKNHTAISPCPPGYNVADYLLEVASDPPVGLFQTPIHSTTSTKEHLPSSDIPPTESTGMHHENKKVSLLPPRSTYATAFLTQLQYLCGREWKILRRDKTLFFTHVAVSSILGVFCGGLYFNIGLSIAGFQSRVGCLFFLGALIAFSSLSAFYNVVETRPLFLRERSTSYYSPSAWLISRFLFDVIPLRIIPTILVSTITYWMAGLAPDAAHFFKFLFILVLYTLVMTLFNFLLGALFHNGGIAILLSALTALYQMTYAGFFVHLNSIPPVLRWLQWLCPLKYTLEALSVNEVNSGLMIVDTLEGVPVNVSASLIMNTLFGFGQNNYYRDVLVNFAFIVGFGIGVIGVVWFKFREQR